MWKKWLAFCGMLGLIVLLDPSPTPAQPGGGKGGFGGPGGERKRDFGGPGGAGAYPAPGGYGGPTAYPAPGGATAYPAPGGGYGQPGGGMGGPGGFTRPGGGYGQPGGATAYPAPGGGFGGPGGASAYPAPGAGMGGPGGGMGGPGGGMGGPRGPGGGGPGGGRPADPEMGWRILQGATGGTGDTIDLGKIPPQTQAMLKSYAERTGSIPLPDSGVMTKAAYLDHVARSEAAKASAAAGGGMGGSTAMDPNGFGRGPRGPGGFGGPGNWDQQNWDPNGQGWGQRPPFEKKDVEEERPVVMRYGKFPKEVKDKLPGWFDDLDTDKDGQVSLYEWRKGSRETKEFAEMDLNGDGLVTVDELIRYERQKSITTKIEAYDASGGAERPANWGLGAPVDGKATDTPRKGGPGAGWPGKGGDRPSGDSSKSGDRPSGDKGSEKGKGNPWGKKN